MSTLVGVIEHTIHSEGNELKLLRSAHTRGLVLANNLLKSLHEGTDRTD